MTERQALLLAGAAHIVLVGLLSVGLARTMPPSVSQPDATPIEFVEIGPEPTITRPPKPSMDAAPREPDPPPPAETPAPKPESKPEPVPDVAPQDAIVAEPEKPAPKPEPKPPEKTRAPEKPKPVEKPAPAKARDKNNFDAGQLAALIDKALPDAPSRPRDVSAFAKSIEEALPKGVKVSPRQVATLEQAIRSQIAPCWNPPMGGADVQNMTVVLRIQLNRDGSVRGQPEFVSQTGATPGNQAYARAFVETARRAVLRCTPLELPDDLYSYWREFELNFDPRLMT